MKIKVCNGKNCDNTEVFESLELLRVKCNNKLASSSSTECRNSAEELNIRCVSHLNDVNKCNINELLQDRNADLVLNMIYNDLFGNDNQTTKELGIHINMLNSENILYILDSYKIKSNETIFSAIMQSFELAAAKRILYCKQVMNKLIDYYQKQGIYVKDIADSFNKELERQRNMSSVMNADLLDIIVDRFKDRVIKK